MSDYSNLVTNLDFYLSEGVLSDPQTKICSHQWGVVINQWWLNPPNRPTNWASGGHLEHCDTTPFSHM